MSSTLRMISSCKLNLAGILLGAYSKRNRICYQNNWKNIKQKNKIFIQYLFLNKPILYVFWYLKFS